MFGEDPNAVVPLDGASLEIEEGQLTAISGRSGSGKTTLFDFATGLTDPAAKVAGTVLFKGVVVEGSRGFASLRRNDIAYSSQTGDLIEFLTLEENIRLLGSLGGPKVGRSRARDALDRVGLGGLEERLPREVSGGQRQRAAVARAIALRSPLLLLDEPTASVDHATSLEVGQLLSETARDGPAVVVATHDEALQLCSDRHLKLTGGRLEVA